MRMVRAGMIAGAATVPVAAGIAFAVRGSAGALAATFAIGLVLANFAISGAALAWAAKKNKVFFPGIAMPSYAVRMIGLFFAINALRATSAIDHPTFALTFGLSVCALLAFEMRIYSKTPWLALAFSPSPTKETP